MKTQRLLPACALILGSASVSCAIDAPVSKGSEALIGGDVDTEDSGAVLVMIKKVNFTKPFEWCTGTVVSPHVIVTAAHCVAVTPADVPEGATLSIFIGSAYDYNSMTPPADDLFYSIAESDAYPGYTDATQQSMGRDIAVIITNDPMPVTPYRMIDAPLDSSLTGQTVRLVGAGANVLPSTMQYSTGTRKTLSLPVTGIDDHYVHESGAAGSSCEGDSGGPTLLTRDGTDYVIGIHAASVGFPECTGANYDTRLDLYTDAFIQPFIDKADPGYSSGSGGAGGSSSSTSTAGGSSNQPPVTKKTNPDSGGCTVGSAPGDASWGWLVGLAGCFWAARRRTSDSVLKT